MGDFLIGPEERIEYVFEAHRGREAPPVMLLRNLSIGEHREFVAAGKALEKATADSVGFLVKTLKIGWAGWQGVLDADGQPVEFLADKDGRPTEAQIERLTVPQRLELCAAIGSQRAEITEDQAKN
ncbi:MAG: hypothetical protein JXQ29_18625 [Planctomycetes bacterium]|nr:hypothetical protein [Planctomycetota bacterium]